MNSLNAKAWLGLAALMVVMGLSVFLPAWTIRYWQAWLFFFVYFAASVLTTVYAMRNDPDLLKRRMGEIRLAEVHWYEAHGIGKKELKRKRYLD